MERAHDLGISAFLSDTIYNFGELVSLSSFAHEFATLGVDLHRSQLMHPILDVLDNTPLDWIKKLLLTFNEGNIGKFEALIPLFTREVRHFLMRSHLL